MVDRSSALVGTCGFAEAQAKTFQDFDILEVQKAFYQPPPVATAGRWREKAGKDFVFTVKAWQLITHEATSPTYRRLTERLSDRQLATAGGFRWNPVTRMAWERTRAVAAALQARAIVFQAPASFVPTRSNINRLYRFFESIDRDDRYMVFEPRGEAWSDAILRGVVNDLDLIHGVDPFLRKPLGRGLRYFRLHGRPAYNYRYQFSHAELNALHNMLGRVWSHYILFNNDAMADDARRFLRLSRNE